MGTRGCTITLLQDHTLELPIAQMRVLFPPGGDNSLVFEASTTRYIMACAQTVVQWQPDGPTEEIGVIGRRSILFPTRWLQRTVSGELMKDNAKNLIPQLEFKPYFQELIHQKALHESEHDRQGAADEIYSLQADLADMSQMLSRTTSNIRCTNKQQMKALFLPHPYTCTHTHTYTYTYIHIHTHTHTYIYIYTHTHTL